MSKIHRALLTLLLLLGAPLPAAAQSIHGMLRDDARGTPVPGARLLLLDAGGNAVDSARSDRTGAFRLRAPAAGTFHVFFQMDGWASVSSDPVNLAAGAATGFEFRVPLVSSAALREMSNTIGMEARLQTALPELCGEPFRAWEAGLLIGTVRVRATRDPVPGARVSVMGSDGAVLRATVASENGVYVLCNVPPGRGVRIRVETPDGTVENTDAEVRAGSAGWYDLPVGPRRR